MKFKIVKENKPNLPTFGKYKAVAMHSGTAPSRQILEETAARLGISRADVIMVMLGLSATISRHLRQGHKVRLEGWGMMKLEIESEKVDSPEDFKPRKHIRGVRLHFLPESSGGSPELYKDIHFERERR